MARRAVIGYDLCVTTSGLKRRRQSQLEKRLSSELLYKGRILRVRVDHVVTIKGRKTTREIVERHPTVSILILDEGGNLLLVQQYRYAVGKTTLEIPAGVVDEGETPEEAARREVREETGYACNSLEKLISYFPAIGYSTEEMTIFLGKDLVQAPLQGDEDEISLVRMPFKEVYDLCVSRNSPFMDAKSNLAVLLAGAVIGRGNGDY